MQCHTDEYRYLINFNSQTIDQETNSPFYCNNMHTCTVPGSPVSIRSVQDRKPLKDDLKIPQSLKDQAAAQMKWLLDQDPTNKEHMEEIVKVLMINKACYRIPRVKTALQIGPYMSDLFQSIVGMHACAIQFVLGAYHSILTHFSTPGNGIGLQLCYNIISVAVSSHVHCI